MAFRAWVCETSRHPQRFMGNIWDCPGCGNETCEDCFDRYAHCKSCSSGKTDEELRLAAKAKGYDFEAEPRKQ